MRIIGFITQAIFTVLMLAIAGLFLLPYVPLEHNIELKIVESGSMEPAIPTGALVIIRPESGYAVDDVITFESRYTKVPTTHRVVDTYTEQGRTWFITKGDANEEADAAAVPQQQIIGRVLYDIPRVGYILDFARQPIGFAFLILLPALLIILSEIQKIILTLKGRRSDSGSRGGGSVVSVQPATASDTPVRIVSKSRRMIDIGAPFYDPRLPTLDLRGMLPARVVVLNASRNIRLVGTAAILVFALIVVSVGTLGSTLSYFNDREVSTGNSFEAIGLGFSVEVDSANVLFEDGVIVGDGGGVLFTLTPEVLSADMRFSVSADVVGSSSPLCTKMSTNTLNPHPFSGLLVDLEGSTITFDTPWFMGLSLVDETGLTDGDVCDVSISFTSWYFDSEEDQGYFDEEEIVLHATYSAPEAATQTESLVPLPLLIGANERSAKSDAMVPTNKENETPPGLTKHMNTALEEDAASLLISEENETEINGEDNQDTPQIAEEEAESESESSEKVEEVDTPEDTEETTAVDELHEKAMEDEEVPDVEGERGEGDAAAEDVTTQDGPAEE